MMQNSETAARGPQYGQRMIFTGPDGIGDYRPRSNYFTQYIGVGATSPEATGDLSYLCRAAPDARPLMPRQSYVGEVGWGWQYNQLLNSGTLLSNMQIKKTDIRAALEDRVSQRFQSTNSANGRRRVNVEDLNETENTRRTQPEVSLQ
ncbi:uncharacterized protein C4orf45 homolog isoform X2 [Archocentrus centrarchus]|uniref:uncharacterized protein C4orf45 homolog isoform X2 n=1 Tax=Archocentrus centrarchus TaxID=63155 RepID=UPI0011EA397C|nr:uncharacterized protein C4orf45 homolog isoform X2 [Archocentrus centrarchus]